MLPADSSKHSCICRSCGGSKFFLLKAVNHNSRFCLFIRILLKNIPFYLLYIILVSLFVQPNAVQDQTIVYLPHAFATQKHNVWF